MNNEQNPMGTDGFEFIEFSSPNPDHMHRNFLKLGFLPVAQHKSKQVTLYQQGNINFILNVQTHSQAEEHAKVHGAGACAMGFRVKDAKVAYNRALELGAEPFVSERILVDELKIPAIKAIGGSVIYFIDHYNGSNIYDIDFEPLSKQQRDLKPAGLFEIDHLTHNVYPNNMDKWAEFYFTLFNFKEIRYFDIKGEKTGLVSRALASPCGKIKIPLNEAKGEGSQIQEFLEEYHGEGIQHIALSTKNIYDTVEALRENGVNFLEVPDTYYEMVNERLPWQQEDQPRLQKNKILIDGEKTSESGLLLQIFTKNVFGPEFFEIIQRKGNEGFGEGNFQALFESIERDQIRRGYLKK